MLNAYYNNYKSLNGNDSINGTCTIVECLGLVNFYGNERDKLLKNDTSSDACLDAGTTKVSSGTSASKVNNCVTESFKAYNSNRTGNTNWWYLYNNIKDEVNGNSPIIFDSTNQSTVAVGLTSFNVTYTEDYTKGALWWKETHTRTVTKTEEFIIVNDTLGRYTKSIVPVELISNITNGMQVCWFE